MIVCVVRIVNVLVVRTTVHRARIHNFVFTAALVVGAYQPITRLGRFRGEGTGSATLRHLRVWVRDAVVRPTLALRS